MNLSKLFSLAGLAKLLLPSYRKHLPDYWPLSEKYVRVCESLYVGIKWERKKREWGTGTENVVYCEAFVQVTTSPLLAFFFSQNWEGLYVIVKLKVV